MYKINDYVVYKKNVCIIKDIKTNSKNMKCYLLNPMDDDSLKIEIPIENSNDLIRNIISKEEANKIIKSIPTINAIDVENNKLFENEYKNLLNTGNHEDLIKVIKTTYLRNQERSKNKKKIGEKDDIFFNKAERLLYNEFSIALNMSFDETKDYVKKQVEKNLV